MQEIATILAPRNRIQGRCEWVHRVDWTPTIKVKRKRNVVYKWKLKASLKFYGFYVNLFTYFMDAVMDGESVAW